MKRAGRLIERICETDNLYLAFYKAKKGKAAKASVQKFEACLDDNIQSIRSSLLSGQPRLGKYHLFKIFDPKERLICSASFPERVIHHAVINVCQECFERHLICHTYATRLGKGVYGAIDYARKAVLRYPYVVKMDVRKYFDSIDHEILRNKLNRLFKDACLLKVLGAVIDSYCTVPGKGLPIGNLTSQYFANYYLSAFDHFMLERCKVPAYVRYMDDFLVFAKTKAEAVEMERLSRDYLSTDCQLELKPSVISPVREGVSFLGYRIFPHKVLLAKRSKVRLKMKMKCYGESLAKGKWSEGEYYAHITPLLSFAQKAYTRKLRAKLISENESR